MIENSKIFVSSEAADEFGKTLVTATGMKVLEWTLYGSYRDRVVFEAAYGDVSITATSVVVGGTLATTSVDIDLGPDCDGTGCVINITSPVIARKLHRSIVCSVKRGAADSDTMASIVQMFYKMGKEVERRKKSEHGSAGKPSAYDAEVRGNLFSDLEKQ